MWHPHRHSVPIRVASPQPCPFWGVGVSPGLWVIPVHPTVQRRCVPCAWAVAQVWGLLRVLGQDEQDEGRAGGCFWGALPTEAPRAMEKGWRQEPCTHQHTQGRSGGFPQCSSGQGAIKHQEVRFPHQLTANFQSKNQGVRPPWAASPPLRHQTHSPRCHRNAFAKSNVRASPAEPSQPHICQAGQAVAAPSHHLRRGKPHPAPLAGAGLPNSAQSPPQAAPRPCLALPAARPLSTTGQWELGEDSPSAPGSHPAGS